MHTNLLQEGERPQLSSTRRCVTLRVAFSQSRVRSAVWSNPEKRRFYSGSLPRRVLGRKFFVELLVSSKVKSCEEFDWQIGFMDGLGGQLRRSSGELERHVIVLFSLSSCIIRGYFVSCQHFVFNIWSLCCYVSLLNHSFLLYRRSSDLEMSITCIITCWKLTSSLTFSCSSKCCCRSQPVLI